MPHGRGLNLSINAERLLNAPVPTQNRKTPEGVEQIQDKAIEEGFDETDIQEVDEGGDNQSLIEMGVAFPKGATRPNSTRRRDREDEDREGALIEEEEREAQRGVYI